MSSQTLHTENAACTLTITATQLAGEVLRLHYRVVNRAAEPLYLYNLFWNDSHVNPATGKEQFEISPHDAYVRLDGQRVHVALAAMRVALSDGLGVRYIPCLTRLETNHAAPFEATLDLHLPLVPYLKSATATPDFPLLLPLHFELGYFLGDAETAKHISPAATNVGLAYQAVPFLASSQHLIATGPFSEPVAVAPWLGKDASRPWE
ncbi:hypothetical protein [Hymenobacter negativus]|uniref:Uncharacterized protein n=1 Tax=Hymenobacter negativus TaxID=2795026 RepID=A0ABS3QG11_9BACT|nr:hypothetical protein [Hymenobacter negativus]MBO2009918.1 hypothetical protein [Hymenobacter negativus]